MLEQEIPNETNERLRVRYMYFCAQSYRDHGDMDAAIQWYRAFLNEPEGNKEDKYTACMSLAELYKKKGDFLNVSLFLCNSSVVDSARIEGIVLLMMEFFQNENHVMVNLLYHKYKGYSREKKPHMNFYQEHLYDYILESFNSVSAHKVGDTASGYECCKKVILHSKHKANVKACTENLIQLYKKQYDKDPVFKSTMERRTTLR
jgi:hypothetical protein